MLFDCSLAIYHPLLLFNLKLVLNEIQKNQICFLWTILNHSQRHAQSNGDCWALNKMLCTYNTSTGQTCTYSGGNKPTGFKKNKPREKGLVGLVIFFASPQNPPLADPCTRRAADRNSSDAQ